jgi:hypothetical protein
MGSFRWRRLLRCRDEYPYCKIFIKGAEPERVLVELAALLCGEFDQMGSLTLAACRRSRP